MRSSADPSVAICSNQISVLESRQFTATVMDYDDLLNGRPGDEKYSSWVLASGCMLGCR